MTPMPTGEIAVAVTAACLADVVKPLDRIDFVTLRIESVDVSGVILAKLDTSSKGGVGFNVSSELNTPILYVGTGESVDDLVQFDPGTYVEALLSP